jgi:Flp pilus assembly protein TadD
MRLQSSLARSLVSAVLTATVAATLAGCKTAGMSDITGSIGGNKSEAAVEADPRQAVDTYGERYRANPKNPEAALRYGQALRATGQRTQAVAVLEQASIVNPGNRPLLAGYGRALVDNGNFQRAFDVLSTAHSPDNPDWRILSVQGTALDQLGRHDEARSYYLSALKIMPEEPSVLSNLGMSYVLSKELPKAEDVLRRAYARPNADPRVRQNLALVVGLQGRFGEAESIVRADLPPEQAAANAAYLKQMLDRKAPTRTGAPADIGDGVPRS